MVDLINKKFDFVEIKTFVELRDSTCTRLTLFNGRLGGEPACLLLEDWSAAEKKEWMINHENLELDEPERKLVQSYGVTFITGKGNNHLVPLIFPPDTVEAVKILCDEL